jgi:hypothetical protein
MVMIYENYDQTHSHHMNRFLQKTRFSNPFLRINARSMSHCHCKQRLNIPTVSKLSICNIRDLDLNLDQIFQTNNNIIVSDQRMLLNYHPMQGYKHDESERFLRRLYTWHLKKLDPCINVLEKWQLSSNELQLCNDTMDPNVVHHSNTVITSVIFDHRNPMLCFFDTIRQHDEKKHRIVVITNDKKKFDDMVNMKIHQNDDDILVNKLIYLFVDNNYVCK